MFLTTNCELSDDQRNYIDELFPNDTQTYVTAIETGEYSDFSDINKLIKALFAFSKVEDAWTNIRANLDKIDFIDIFKCPYMQMDRTASDVYKYMYDNNIIDDTNYRYFEVLSGKLNDWDFWKKQFENKSTVEIFDLLNESFNLLPDNNNIYNIGLIELTPEQEEYIFSKLEDGQMLDFILTDRPSANITPTRIIDLLINHHLEPKHAGLYFRVVLEMYATMYDITVDDKFTPSEIIISLYDVIWEYSFNNIKLVIDSDSGIEVFRKIISDMQLDTLDKIKSFIAWCYYVDDEVDNAKITQFTDEDFMLKILVNNPLFMIYSYTIMDYLSKVSGEKYTKVKLSSVLDDNVNLGMVISYKLHPLFESDDYIIKYPFPQYPMVYSKKSNKLLIGNKIYDKEDTDILGKNVLGFIDDYIISDTVNQEIYNNFNSEEEYAEFIRAAKDFASRI